MDNKRKADNMIVAVSPKKAKTDLVVKNSSGTVQATGPPRTSALAAPIMQLSGHQGEILCGRFHPDGESLVTAGMDRKILFWKVYGECENFGELTGHKNAITELSFSTDGSMLYTASADKFVLCWDLTTGTKLKKFKGHTAFVNSVCASRRGPSLLATAGDDCAINVWDQRARRPATTFTNSYQVTSVTFNDTSEQVITGGIDNDLKVWDMRKNAMAYRLRGHTNTVTGLALSPDGSYVLSNAMDNTLRVWDVRAYAPAERCCKIFKGHQHNFEQSLLRCAWSADGRRVSCGSSDRHVHVWDTTSRALLYRLPGHRGGVNEVAFHPKEPIIMSVSNDKQIFLGEIEGV